jgi:diguanylate cyclase (GGDEF)-like protein/PAS domain S-box-containing protein
MSVRFKVLLLFFSSLLLIAICTVIITNALFSMNNNEQELKSSEENLKIINLIINNEKSGIAYTTGDWSRWDDTYEFIKDGNSEYLNSNLQNDTFASLNLNFIIFLNKNGDVVYSKGFDLTSNSIFTIDNETINQINKNNLLNTLRGIDDTHVGLLYLSGKLAIAAAYPITSSDLKQLPDGTLIMGRFLNNSFVDYINGISQNTVEFQDSINANADITFKGLNDNNNLKLQRNSNTLTGFSLLKDIYGSSSIMVKFTSERSAYNLGFQYITIALGIFFIFMIVLIISNFLFLKKIFLDRLNKLTHFLNTVAENKNLSSQIVMSGKDEIYQLSNSANKMLSELDSAYNKINIMDERFNLIMEATNDGYFDINLKTKELYIDPLWKKLIGFKSDDEKTYLRYFYDCIDPEFREKVRAKFQTFINSNQEYYNMEFKIMINSGETIWINHRGKIVERDENGIPVRLISVLSNITSRMKNEIEIMYLSYSDKLTGLKNRSYMEKMFDKIDQKGTKQYSIIMGDLNGLKLTNDAFGHKEGDKLLCAIAEILRNNCAKDDEVARWGGDEFVVLVVDKKKKYVNGLIDKIKVSCERSNDTKIKFSISLGSAETEGRYVLTEELMKIAEERMYRNKLLEHRSVRNSTIISLETSLFEKDSETEEHTQRLSNMSKQIGIQLALSQDKLDELELLGLLHDIGKIGVPEQILNKPGKLTDKEWKIMKSHTEIGYRIATSIPELAHIANDILCHHEKFDGTGYPQGLKGQEIPILSRIVNIVDSFDAMTHNRCYKNAYSLEKAEEELKKCAGKQFDPELVLVFFKLLDTGAIDLT